jgi:hypothetical protein
MYHYIPDSTDDPHSKDLAETQFMLPELVKQFILAGNATFTVRSKETGKRFTYKVKKSMDKWFCSLLTGPSNESDFRYFGFIVEENGGYKYVHGKPGKSCAARTAESVKAFTYTVGNVFDRNRIPDGVEFWHAGRCGRCARQLTDPVSIESGYGPECINKIGG